MESTAGSDRPACSSCGSKMAAVAGHIPMAEWFPAAAGADDATAVDGKGSVGHTSAPTVRRSLRARHVASGQCCQSFLTSGRSW